MQTFREYLVDELKASQSDDQQTDVSLDTTNVNVTRNEEDGTEDSAQS